MSKQAHQPQRFEVYKELKDGSGFTIAGSERVYKFDRLGGWFDEYGNYYDADGRPEDPPSDEGESEGERSRSHSDYEDEFEREFGRPVEYEEDEVDTAHIKNLERSAANISTLQAYPAKTPLRVHFRNVAYISKREEVFAWAKSRVQGLLNLIFSFNQKGFSGKGYFVVENVNAAEQLLKLEGERYGEREIAFDLEELEEFLLYPLNESELTPDKGEKKYVKKAQVKDGPKKYVNVQESHHVPEKKVELKPIVIAETIKQEPKVEKKEEKKEVKKEEKKEEKKVNLEEFASYTFLKKAFPKKSSFKDWLGQHKINSEDFKQVQKIAGNEEYAKITMKRKVYEALNNTVYNGDKIVFKEQ